jgi:hypothetical protein
VFHLLLENGLSISLTTLVLLASVTTSSAVFFSRNARRAAFSC